MRASRLWLTLACVSCASCNAVWGVEAGTLKDEEPIETDACTPEPGVAKLCVEFEIPPHPLYDSASGATALGIDGKGFFTTFLFDKDPNDPTAGYVQRWRFPDMKGNEVSIDAPPTLAGSMKEGTYWLDAYFEDDKTSDRPRAEYFHAGDFRFIPGRATTGAYIYPEVKLVAGETARVKLLLQPMRRVDVELTTDPQLKVTYKDFAVNGDGPVVFVLFDGAFDTAPFLEFYSTDCLFADPFAENPPTLARYFTTVITGTHKFAASLEDYDSINRFPTDGSLLTQTEPAPSLTIPETGWSASTSARFVRVLNPVAAASGKMDANVCR